MEWPHRTQSYILEDDYSNWHDWYDDFMARYGQGAAAVAIDPESKAPDGTLYTDDEALQAARGPKPEKPAIPEQSDDIKLYLVRILVYSIDIAKFSKDSMLYEDHLDQIHEECMTALDAITDRVPLLIRLDVLKNTSGPRSKLAALRANCVPDGRYLRSKREREYEDLKLEYSWVTVEDWIRKWTELMRKLHQADSHIMYQDHYYYDLLRLIRDNGPSFVSERLPSLLLGRYMDHDPATMTVAQHCTEVAVAIVAFKLDYDDRLASRRKSTRRGSSRRRRGRRQRRQQRRQ